MTQTSSVLEVSPTAAVDPRRSRVVAQTAAARVIGFVLFIWALATAMFFLVRLTGDPATVMAGPDATMAQVEALNRLYGFDQSVWSQYLKFLRQFVTLDFGTSTYDRLPARDVVLGPLSTTLRLCSIVILFDIIIALPLGLYLGRRPATRLQRLVESVVIGMQAVQSYIMALVLVAVFSIGFGWFPAVGLNSWTAWVLPVVSLLWLVVPRLARIVQSTAEHVWSSEYVTFAKAYGYGRRRIWWGTVAPNVAIPTVAAATTQFTLLISGAVLIEGLFNLPGIGTKLITAVQHVDFQVTIAGVVFIGIVVFAVTTVVDLSYRFLDPRTR